MATYPLKNISIGGDTYEIQAGTDLFDFYVRVNCDYREITTSNIVSIGVSKNWQQIPTADIWSTMSGDAANSAQVQLSIAPNEYAPSGAEGCNLWVLNRYPYSSGSVSSQDYIFISEPYTKNGSTYMTKVVITVNENNQLSGVGESIALGGSGGGSSITTYVLQDQYGQAISVNQFSSGLSGAKLMNTADGTFATDADVLTAFAAGEVIINVGSQWEAEKLHLKVDSVSEGAAVKFCGTYYISGNSGKTFIFNYSNSSEWQISNY